MGTRKIEKEAAKKKASEEAAIRNSRRRKSLTTAQIMRQDIIAPLFKRGYSYRELRDEVMARLNLKAYSLYTVKRDIDDMLEEWRQNRVESIELNLQLELNRIDTLVREAWEAWDKSKQDYQKRKMRQDRVPSIEGEGVGNGESDMALVKASQITEEMTECGDPRYIETINRLLIERRKLLGLYAPEKTLGVSAVKVSAGDPSQMSIEDINKEIERLEKLDK